MTSAFGPRRHPVTGAMDQHRGIDLAAPVGTPVEVPYGGRVVSVGHDKLLGLHMTVEHMGGWRSLYAHLSSVQVKAGGKVRARQVIARSGASGRVTGPHLHFALYRNGHAVDPARWIRVRQDTDVNTRK
ncbi:MAG: M23 family metallopeptidase [Myxococcota bacterium]